MDARRKPQAHIDPSSPAQDSPVQLPAGECVPDRGAARSVVVNRTHRIIRDQALTMREQRSRSRSLLAPLFICSALLLVVCYAAWAVMAGYDLTPTGVPDASDQVLLLLLWSLPVTIVVLALIWLRRRSRGEQTL